MQRFLKRQVMMKDTKLVVGEHIACQQSDARDTGPYSSCTPARALAEFGPRSVADPPYFRLEHANKV